MAVSFQQTLPEALKEIDFQEQHTFSEYSAAQWAIVDLVNERYNAVLKNKFDLYHWLWYYEEDELAYFLIEAGSNALHAGNKPLFRVWLGTKGFVVGVDQQHSFNAQEVTQKRGGGMDFFHRSKSVIFFDHHQSTKTVYFLYYH